MRKTSLVFPLPPSFKRLHPVSRRWGARTSSGVEVQVSRVHRVLAAVAWGGGYMWVLQDLTGLDNYSVFLSPSTLRTYHWVSFRCSGNICCCESTGIQCTDQSPSAWCGRWRLRRNIGVKKIIVSIVDSWWAIVKQKIRGGHLSECCLAWCPCGWIPSCARCPQRRPARRCRTWRGKVWKTIFGNS